MRFHTFTQFQIEDEIGVYTRVVDVVVPYSGPWSLAVGKKEARNITGTNAQLGQAASKQQQANSQGAYDQAQKNLAPYNAMGPADMTQAADAQLAADNANINNTYNGLRKQAFTTLGQRGFGGAPGGFQTAVSNGLDQGLGNSEQKAFENAQINSQGQKNFATQTEAGLAGQQGSLAEGNLGQSTGAAATRVKEGSTAGDVAQGVGDALSLVSPALGAGQGIAKAFSQIGSNPMSSGMIQNIPGVSTYNMGPNKGGY